MSCVSVTREALRELRERMAASPFAGCVCIIGPLEGSSWLETDLEEVWQLEKLYGTPPRWSLHLAPRTGEPAEPNIHVEEVEGIAFEIWTSKAVPRLRIELRGEALRVHEVDA